MASKTDAANLAISHLGTAKLISDLETDKSNEAKVCRLFYDKARKACLKDFPFPFTRAFTTLSLVESNPTEEWAFSYRYPSNCLLIRRIFSGNRMDASDTRIPYLIGRDEVGLLIYTDVENAKIEFTYDEESVDRFSDEFLLAMSYRLAAYIAPALSNGNPKLGENALKMYFNEISKAAANANNEEQKDQDPESSFIRARY